MPDFTWLQILAAIGGSGGIITLILGIAKFVSERFDVRIGRREKIAEAATHESTELKRIKSDDAENVRRTLQAIIAERNDEIIRLKAEIGELKAANVLTRPTVTAMYKALRHLEDRFKNLRATACPDEVADVINAKVSDALRSIGEMRDLLP